MIAPLNICVLIPSYNEAKSIGKLVEKIKAQKLDVLVVDDGSADNTSEIAQKRGAYVIRHAQNKGKGASLKDGFEYALKNGYDAVITMDGDGQHSPDDIPHFINMAHEQSVDIIVGNRMFSTKNMPPLRWLTNKTMSCFLSAICRTSMPDSQCGFRLIKKEVFKNINPTSNNYEIETETLVEAHQKGFKIKFVPIQTIYSKQTSNINPFIDTIRFFRYLLKIFCPFLFRKR